MTSIIRQFSRVAIPFCAVIIWLGAASARAGDLNPPAGPVAPTHKTLTEIEPRTAISMANTPGDADSLYKITQPGSYYLTGSITGVAGKHGVEIATSGVSLDLMGFPLTGVAGSLDGVSVTVNNLQNISVFNGSVRSWGDEGIDLGTMPSRGCRVERILAVSNAGNGIAVGLATTVSDCSAYINTGHGIATNSGCTVSMCTTYANSDNGINTGAGCSVIGCSSNNNTNSGILTGFAGTISNCSTRSNFGVGINAAGFGTRVDNCTAYQNALSGIEATSGCSVVECTTRINTLDGILCSNQCVIRDNTCSSDGLGGGDGAGIHATGTDNRIEGNNCTGADRGIDVDADSNIIIRNTCAGNTTDWDIVANNVFGPIIDQRIPASPAVSGFSAAGSLGSTDPNANFSY